MDDNSELKIANITLDGYQNYGGILQRYAFCEVLKKYTNYVDSLWHNDECLIEKNWEMAYPWIKKGGWNIKLFLKMLLNWKKTRTIFIYGRNYKSIYRDSLIKNFADRYINIRYDVDFNNVSSEYDYFIVGSDQVWNPKFNDLEKCMLLFAPKEKRIAYAASIAVPEIPQRKKAEFIDGINSMKAISVRENDGAKLINELTGRKVDVVVDPTMLLSVEQWRKISRKPSWLKEDEKYIVTYYLGKCPDDAVKYVAEQKGLKVINIYGNNIFNTQVVSPEEWLYLIDYAKLLYTDSFHGTAFSIQFKTPFIVTERIELGNMTSRINTLLNMFDLTDRIAGVDNKYMIDKPYNIDFGEVENILEVERKKAFEYLDKVLKTKV